MLKKLKNILGIEGVKLHVDAAEAAPGHIQGVVRFYSPDSFFVENLVFKLEEVYSRGRFGSKRVDTYLLKEWRENIALRITGQTPTEWTFESTFQQLRSPIDHWSSEHWTKGVVGSLAKRIAGVDSTIVLTVSARVKGIALHPYHKVVIRR